MDEIVVFEEEIEDFQIACTEEVGYSVSLANTTERYFGRSITGLHKFRGNEQLLLCLNNAVYVLDGAKILSKNDFGGMAADCFRYVPFQLPNCSQMDDPMKYFFFLDDNTIQSYHFHNARWSFDEKYIIPERACFTGSFSDCHSLVTGTKLYFTNDSRRIFVWDITKTINESGSVELHEVYNSNSNKLIVFGISKNEENIVFISKSVFDNKLYALYGVLEKGVYVPTKEFDLQITCNDDFITEQIDNGSIILLSQKKMWFVYVNSAPLPFKNLGLAGDLLLTLHCNTKKSDNMLLEVIYASGRIFRGEIPSKQSQIKTVDWSEGLSLDISPGEIFTYASLVGNHVYVTASNSCGIWLQDRKKNQKLKYENCLYRNATYFDMALLYDNDADVDCKLYCGAYSANCGFLEKRSRQVHKAKVNLVRSELLKHSPIVDMWATEIGILYESFGRIYCVQTNELIGSSQNRIWINNKGQIIRDDKNDILLISQVVKEGGQFSNLVVELKKDGVIAIVDYDDVEKFTYIYQHKTNIDPFIVTAIAAFLSHDGETHFALSHGMTFLSFISKDHVVKTIKMTNITFVANILLKCIFSRLFYVITGMDGGCAVYVSESSEPIMEIKCEGGSKLHAFDVGNHSGMVLLYNRNQVIVVDILNRTHHEIEFPIQPFKIFQNKHDSEGCDILHILDYRWHLSVVYCNLEVPYGEDHAVDNSRSYYLDLKGQVPLQILTIKETTYHVVTMKSDFKQKSCLSLLRSDNMEIIHHYALPKGCSRIILRALWNNTSEPDSCTDFRLRGSILVYYVQNGNPFCKIISIQENHFILQQVLSLPTVALEIDIDHDKFQVSFIGTTTAVYEISINSSDGNISLSPLTICTQDFAKCQLPSNASLGIESDFLKKHPIKLIGHKTIETFQVQEKRHLNDKVKADVSPVLLMKGLFVASICQKLQRKYTLYVDCFNYITIKCITNNFKIADNGKASLFAQFGLNSNIANVSTVSGKCSDNHVARTNHKCKYLMVPLFTITCADGQVFILYETIGFKPSNEKKPQIISSVASTLPIYDHKWLENVMNF